MAAKEIKVSVTAKLPRWWRLYVVTCWAWCRIRGTEHDVDKMAQFVANHARYDMKVLP